MRALSLLYSRKQDEKQHIAVFLRQQYLLAHRLQPDDLEE